MGTLHGDSIHVSPSGSSKWVFYGRNGQLAPKALPDRPTQNLDVTESTGPIRGLRE